MVERFLSTNLALILVTVFENPPFMADGSPRQGNSSADSQTELKWNMIVISTQWSAPNWTVS